MPPPGIKKIPVLSGPLRIFFFLRLPLGILYNGSSKICEKLPLATQKAETIQSNYHFEAKKFLLVT